MSTNPIIDTVTALVAPIVSGLQLDLYDLELNGGLLRITVDTPAGSTSGVTLDQLSLINRLVGRDLDHHDPIPGHYTLEVTSPGLERSLRTPAHFHRATGSEITIRLTARATDGERRLQGILVAAGEADATVSVEGVDRVVPYSSIDRARTVFHWGGNDKPGKVGKHAGAKKQGAAKPAAGGAKPAPGPSDELDPSILEEANS